MKIELETVHDRIQAAARACGRDPASITLVAVSKTISTERVKTAIEAGVTILGENYVQEARDKISALSAYHIGWHFIGHLQSNKAKYAVRLFDLIHTVDSVKLAQELDKQAKKNDKVQPILIQVNISAEATKSGADPEAIFNLLRRISPFENISVRGLMTMPPFFDDPDRARPYFAALREMRDRIIQENIPNIRMDELSMGMTGDFEVAIAEGATLVRVGTAIFGARQ